MRKKLSLSQDVYKRQPVNSAMIKAYGGTYRTEAQVAAFNKSIRMSLCLSLIHILERARKAQQDNKNNILYITARNIWIMARRILRKKGN